MFTVYKITNLINQKCYIGSSICVEKRWKQHINTSKNINSKHYHYPLYKAFRKYGLENFSFEILKDDFNSPVEMQLFENQMILYFDSCEKGYNQTYKTIPSELAKENLQKYLELTKQACAKVDNNDNIIEKYSSYHEAAEKNGYDRNYGASTIRRVCKGLIRSNNNLIFKDLDKNGLPITPKYITEPRCHRVMSVNVETLEEHYYESISEASRITGLDRNRIQKCINGEDRYSCIHKMVFRTIDKNNNIIETINTPTLEERLEQYNLTNPEINGERHNIKEWCEIYNLSRTSYYKRLKKGMSVIQAITTPKGR